MLKWTIAATTTNAFKKPTLQCRYASVLSTSSFPSNTSRSSFEQHHNDLPYIITPASAPFTTPSNNAFHPAHIPKKTQARLTLDELKQVLDSSKQLFQQLQQDYVDKSLTRTPLELQQFIEQLTNEQLKLIESLSSSHRRRGRGRGLQGKKSSRNNDNNDK